MGMTLGPFRLVEPLAVGGMATVWRALHGDMPVAMKFMSKGKVRHFADEMRLHARLTHPHILAVLDYGVLEHDLNASLTAGTPWMALEFAGGGDLTTIQRDVRWIDVRTIALTVLDALSTAHSYGLVHCDLKLSNVLLSGPRDARPGLKLADFGIAQSIQGNRGPTGGTPRMMAPEQVRAAVVEYGPWTDIFGLGCMVHQLVSGRFSVPDGLETWIGQCLSAAPADRFKSAVEAREALELLPKGRQRSVCHPSLAMMRRPTRSTAQPALPLYNAGVSLFAVRSWPTLGRDQEEAVLWGALDLARQTHRPRAVILHGESGIGVSHLAREFARSAEIRGLGRWFRHTAHPDEGPTDGLIRFVKQIVRCAGLQGEKLAECLAIDHRVWNSDPSLLAILQRLLFEEGAPHAVRRGALRRLVVDRSQGRPAVVVMDAIQHSRDARAFVANTLRNLQEPWLFVVGTDSLESVPEIAELDGVQGLELAPLLSEFVNRLIYYVLPLESEFRSEVMVRAAGNPGRLAAELERWVRSGLLEPSPFGYRPRGGIKTRLPEDAGKVDSVVQGLPPGARRALERAAIWGTRIPHAVWGPLCEEEGRGIPLARLLLLERLKERDLAREGGSFWEFTSTPFRRLVLDQMSAAKTREAHRVAARVSRTGAGGLKLARHLRDAGDLEGAAKVYASTVMTTNAVATVSVLVTEALEVLDLLGVSASDPRRGAFRTRALIHRQSSTQSFAEATQLQHDADEFGWAYPAAQARSQVAIVASILRSADETFALCEEAVAFARTCSPDVLPRILGPLAHTICRLGRPRRANELLEEALSSMEGIGSVDVELEQAELELRAVWVYSQTLLGSPPSFAYIDDLAARLADAKMPMRSGKVLNVGGDVARLSGALDQARSYYLAALDAVRLCGLNADHLRLNLGMLALELGDDEEAQRWLDRGLTVTKGRFNGMYAPVVSAMELDLAALLGDVEAFRVQLRQLTRLLPEGPPEPDLVVLLARAADRIRPRDAALAAQALGLRAAAIRACTQAGIALNDGTSEPSR